MIDIKRSNWGKVNYRKQKKDLFEAACGCLQEFSLLDKNNYEDNPIQLLDFFCGAGGTSLGFATLNKVIPAFKMLGGCDINKVSAETYAHNYGTPIINDDVVRLAYEDGALENLMCKLDYNAEAPLVLIGCAPCQGFSSHRKKHWNQEDDRNSLVIAFVELVKQLRPDVIIMENVPEFLSNKYWRYFSKTKEKYQELGYTVKQCIYNAASFGVPQERFRSIIIGMKKEFLLPSEYLKPEEFKTVRQTIGMLKPVKAGVADPKDPMHKSAAHKQSTIEVIKSVPHDGGNRPAGIGPKCLDKTKGFSDVYGRLFWDRPSITITHYARNPASGRFTHPEQDRGLTAREAALLQSFPRGFEFTGKADDIYRQIGEAVPPLLATAVATNVLIELVSCSPSANEIENSPNSMDEPVSNSYSSVIAGIKNTRKVAKI